MPSTQFGNQKPSTPWRRTSLCETPDQIAKRPAAALRLATTVVVASMSALGVATNANAQANTAVYLFANAEQGNDPAISSMLYDSVGPAVATSGSTGGFGGYATAAASLGVLHSLSSASASADSPTMDSDYDVQSADSGSVYADVVYVSDPSMASTAYIPTTVTFALTGQLHIIPPPTYDPVLGIDVDASVALSSAWYTITGPISDPTFNSQIAENDYGEYDAYQAQGTDQGPADPPSEVEAESGTLSFTTFLQNDTYYGYTGSLLTEALDSFGGESDAFFSDTAFFNVTSSDSNATFIGSLGTNYGALSESGGAASAPEPASMVLLASGAAGAVVGLARSRRRKRSS